MGTTDLRSRLQNVFETDDPVAIVTGSGSPRVGRVIAEELSRRGCHVALHANTSVDEAEQAASQWQQRFGREAIVVQGPLEQDATCDAIVDQTRQHFGRLDILVNSAAIWTPTRLENITGEEIRRYFQINSVASLLCARAAGRHMVAQSSGGCIINLGDWATVRPYAEHAAYFPSKGAIEVMTRSLAVELGAKNARIRVNCVQPGPVLLSDDVSQETVNELADSTLVRRVGTPEDVSHAVSFFCENTFVTGVCLPVDGGRSIFAPDGLQIGRNTG
ncbi:SDR family NAD(P)-dependent oxidoreductase [Rhodopirellula baltica]|uniref:Short-chain dehydrogenase/reductase SDR n=1 Tax=Rhodopirellula baltica WH47 TaxID=991778 RepID=F2ARN4_RHOBT|nr:SDR family oxidoreductase [Rhodopirellula baltica]EGF27674.1 short-chain dehydrogenase/reductase SDR [Rhodopirellula baltica WH47]